MLLPLARSLTHSLSFVPSLHSSVAAPARSLTN